MGMKSYPRLLSPLTFWQRLQNHGEAPALSHPGRRKKWFYPISPNFCANLKLRILRLQNLPTRHLPAATKPLFFLKFELSCFLGVLPVFLGLVSFNEQLGKQKSPRSPIEGIFSQGNVV